jgi:hypothetical protein
MNGETWRYERKKHGKGERDCAYEREKKRERDRERERDKKRERDLKSRTYTYNETTVIGSEVNIT